MISTGNTTVNIYTEITPNPDTLKFVANRLLYPAKSADFQNEASTQGSPLASALFGFPFIQGVFIASNFVTLTKTKHTDWADVVNTLQDFLKTYLEENRPIIHEDQLVQQDAHLPQSDDPTVVKRIKELLENYVKPAVEIDGGAIQFKDYTNGVLRLSLQGSCSGCPSSMITLKNGIEGMMRRMIPEVQEVIADTE